MKKLFIVFFVILSLVAFAEPDSVLLKYDFDKNPYQAFQMITTTKSKFSVFGVDQNTGSKLILNIHREISKTDKKGIYKIVNVVDSGKIIINGKESKYNGQGNSTEVLMDAYGNIIKAKGSNGQPFKEIKIAFPKKPLRKGDYWGTSATFDISELSKTHPKLGIKVKFVLEGFTTYKGYDCAVITSKFQTDKIDEKYFKAEVNGNGKIYFAYKEGRLIANYNKLKIKFEILSDKNDAGKLRKVFGVKIDMLTQLTAL